MGALVDVKSAGVSYAYIVVMLSMAKKAVTSIQNLKVISMI